MIRIETVGKTRISVKFIQPGCITAQVVHIQCKQDLTTKDITGKILILNDFADDWTSLLRYVAGIIIEPEEHARQLQVVGMAYNFPIVISATSAMELIPDGATVELNDEENLVQEI